MVFIDILRPLGVIMADILKLFYTFIPSYGWGIVFLTFLLRLVLFPTSISQVRSMEKMKVIQPKLKEIQDKYKDKPEELQRRMMELYRENKVNPLGSCLPLLLQMPFLFALYGLLMNPVSYGIKGFEKEYLFGVLLLTQQGVLATAFGASFGNLVLAVLSAVTTYIQQKVMSPAQTTGTNSASSMQATFLYIMPLFFGYITFTMAAALGLYWVSQNVIGIAQQLLIVKFFVPPAKAAEQIDKPRRKSR